METNAERSFAELLRSARQKAGLSQQQLAVQAGVSTRAVSDLERGINRAPRRETLRLLAEALNITATDRRVWESICKPVAHEPRSTRSVAESEQPNKGNLPLPATSFIGRDTEVAQAVALLTNPDVRLLTLTGPGGVGKTRLAIAIGRAVEQNYPDGVRFVNLAPLRDPTLVLPTIAQTLGVRNTGVETIYDALVGWLRWRTIALLLDNVEHLVTAAPDLATLLDACPGLTVLATSRSRLHIQAEREFQVPPLAIPAGNNQSSPEELGRISAIRLFVQRAQAVKSDFRLTSENAPAVVAICTHLDGLPLAIELAASRMRLLPPRELLVRLARSLPLLTGGPRDAPARQQTLYDTIAWSYELLNDAEQRLFRQLTIFAGGWTLESAEAVCDPDLDVLDGLTTLIDHNLVRQTVQHGDESRYSMLETIHEFGLERLAEHGESIEISERHLFCVTRTIERMRDELNGPDQGVWLDRGVAEIDNVRTALTYALERRDGMMALRLAIASEGVWASRSILQEGRDWLSKSLAIASDLPAEILADAYIELGSYTFNAHDYAPAEHAFERAIELYRLTDNQLGVAQGIQGLAWSAIYEGRYELATELEEQALKIASTVGDQLMMASVYSTLALLMTVTGEYELAITRCQESLELHRAAGDRIGASHALGFLGTIALWQGDLERATRWGEEALATAPKTWIETAAFANELLGYVELERANYHEAGTRLRTSLALRDPDQNGMVVAECFEGLAGVAAGLKDPTRGASLLGAAEAMRERFRTPIPPPRQDCYDRTLAAIKHQISPVVLMAAWKLGRSLSGPDAVSYGLERDTLTAHTTKARLAGALSTREIEVLRLLADGLSDREIADKLFISHHTVAHHVASILNKLGVSSRTAAATRAVRDNLI